jgi:hypothetical protein
MIIRSHRAPARGDMGRAPLSWTQRECMTPARTGNMSGHIAFLEKTLFQEHVSVIGGLILAAILGELRKD